MGVSSRVAERPPVAEAAAPAVERGEDGGRGFSLLRRLRLERADLAIMGILLVVAFGLRYFSPIMPDLFAGKLWPAVGDCVHSTPVDQRGDPGTLCGLAYPYQRSYAAPGQAPSPPNGQVFDEIYFAVFAHDDLTGVAYFDPEPPLAKELIAAGEWLDGWWRATFQGARGSYADLGFNTYGWRLMVCVFGTLCVPLMYLLAHLLWRNRWFALAAAVMACFDGLFFVESRIAVIDIFPIFFILLAYTCFLVHLGSRGERDSLATLLLTGVVLGLGIAAKWIVLAAWASILMFLVVRPLVRHVGVTVGRGDRAWTWGGMGPGLPGGARPGRYVAVAAVSMIGLPVAIYLASWFPFFLRGQFHDLHDLLVYNWQAYEYQATLTATHPYGSAWYSWPFLYRPVAYYYQYQGLGIDGVTGRSLVAGIVNLGNPVIWWASIPALLTMPYFVLRHRSFPAAVILVGYVTQYLPWSRVTRVLFLYHYFGALIFAILALAFVLARMQQAGPVRLDLFGGRHVIPTGWLVPAFLALVVVAFAYFYPVWTALPISDQAYLSGFPAGKMWLRTWI